MRVIIINDSSSHAHAVAYNAENMKALLIALIESRMVENIEEANDLCQNPTTTPEEIESFLFQNDAPIGRTGGGMIYCEELKTTWDFLYSPFE